MKTSLIVMLSSLTLASTTMTSTATAGQQPLLVKNNSSLVLELKDPSTTTFSGDTYHADNGKAGSDYNSIMGAMINPGATLPIFSPYTSTAHIYMAFYAQNYKGIPYCVIDLIPSKNKTYLKLRNSCHYDKSTNTIILDNSSFSTSYHEINMDFPAKSQ
jgi:hypothetical protein